MSKLRNKKFLAFSERLNKLAIKAAKNKEAKEELCKEIRPYIIYLIKKSNYPLTKDTIQVGFVSVLEALSLFEPSRGPFLYYLRFVIPRELAYNNSLENGLKKSSLIPGNFKNNKHPNRLQNLLTPIDLDANLKKSKTPRTRIEVVRDKSSIEEEVSYNLLLDNISVLSEQMLSKDEAYLFGRIELGGDMVKEHAKIRGVIKQTLSAKFCTAKSKMRIGLKAYGYR
ncbi:MAG: hypothetical protein GY679_01630 [Mycoplasma sp.]|nr:hypothetical protein [Mycoplasma sp.]